MNRELLTRTGSVIIALMSECACYGKWEITDYDKHCRSEFKGQWLE